MQEQQHQIKIYGFLQKAVYATVVLDSLILCYQNSDIPVASALLKNFAKMGLFYPPFYAKCFTVLLIAIVASGTRAKKKRDLSIIKEIVLPIIIGLLMMFGVVFLRPQIEDLNHFEILPKTSIYGIVYMIFSLIGAMITQMGADSISKYMQTQMGKDRWNTEEESFAQNTELKETPYSINIPYLFRYGGKINKGWLNINPFRGTIVIGTPGSGKSFGVINPAIRQMVQKDFCLCIYDYKFPDLAKIAYYHFIKKKISDPDYKHKFAVINLNDVEKSYRVNPLRKDYIRTLIDAQEIAEALVSSMQKGGGSGGGGSEQFFTQSAINFLGATIYFFAKFDNGKYSDLPHILSFMNRSYKEIFDTLFSNIELTSLMSPFESAYRNKAYDQLEGQVGTVKIFLSRLATKETFYIFSGDEIELKITDPQDPTILILASDPDTQDINSALYAAVLNRLMRLINHKGNLPGGIIADEFPTIYIHKIDNLIATARSNKVAVLLGLQELPQLEQYYKKEVGNTITSIMGNVLSGSVRKKDTLEWLQTMFGKIKQKSYSQSISQQGTTTSINEKMDYMIPSGKISALRTGEMVGMIAQSEENESHEYQTSAFSGKINLNMKEIKKEEIDYPKMPQRRKFKDKDAELMANLMRINLEVEMIVNHFYKPDEKK